MTKTILITGSTDGIGLATARLLVGLGHHVLLHGRNPSKLERVESELSEHADGGQVAGFAADLSVLAEVEALATSVADKHGRLDVLINNAGVFVVPDPATADGLDARFAVNTLAPYLLTQRLLPLLGTWGRVVNLSSAAQSPVDLHALASGPGLSDGEAYAQSKLALTMWSRSMALSLKNRRPAILAVNPGSMLNTKMVQQAYNVAGADVGVGADVLRRAALSDDFAEASGDYFDNDSGRFAAPHRDVLDARKSAELVQAIEAVLAQHRAS